MKHRNRAAGALIAILAIAALQLSACKSTAEREPTEPAEVQAVTGAEIPRVTLTEEGIRLIGMKTARVREIGGHRQIEIPYGAVIYDPNGRTYAFTQLGSRTFQRKPIAVAKIDGNTVILSDGPPAGTKVVTVGASELYGAETGVEE